MTGVVGGLWDSLLAEGKSWWITANSTRTRLRRHRGPGPNSNFPVNGRYGRPGVLRRPRLTNGDFWPGFYSRTHVGAESFSYASVMDAIRAGRVWVDHGG